MSPEALTPVPAPLRLALRPPGTMAHVGHRVDYLAGFCCPVGGLVAGKPRVLCHENEIYLSNGSEFVYVYDQEGKVLKVSSLAGLGASPCVPCAGKVLWGQEPLGPPPRGRTKAAGMLIAFPVLGHPVWDQTPSWGPFIRVPHPQTS